MSTRAPLLRPEFGPTLPELLSRRLRVSPRAIGAVALAALVVALVVVKVVIDNSHDQLTVHGKPSFNVLYDGGQLHRATPRAGELMRLAGHSRHLDAELTARRANLPPYNGDVIGGQLPLYTAQYLQRVKARLPGFALNGEGKARLNKAPGYQIAYTAGSGANHTVWRAIFVMPKADQPDQTIVLQMRQAFSGRQGPRDRALLAATKAAYRSLRFGTGRPFFG
jgi:hypothetical protein